MDLGDIVRRLHDELIVQPIQVMTLATIIRLDLRPDTLQPVSLRRHHKTRVLMQEEVAPLGFTYPSIVKKRS